MRPIDADDIKNITVIKNDRGFLKRIDAPILDVKPVIKGKWIYKKENWHCSICDETPKTIGYTGNADFMKNHFKFCNHCGASMEVEE